MANERTEEAPKAKENQSAQPNATEEKRTNVPFGPGGVVERTGDPEAGLEEAYDVTDETANKQVFLADIGTSLTSHGDGQSTLPPDMVTAREDEEERNEDPDRDNRALARELGRDV